MPSHDAYLTTERRSWIDYKKKRNSPFLLCGVPAILFISNAPPRKISEIIMWDSHFCHLIREIEHRDQKPKKRQTLLKNGVNLRVQASVYFFIFCRIKTTYTQDFLSSYLSKVFYFSKHTYIFLGDAKLGT